jgi:methyltransferase (TIGR00027 family)
VKAGQASDTALRIAGNKIAALRDPELRKIVSDPDEPYSDWFIRAHSARARRLRFLWTFGPTRRLVMRLSDTLLPGGALHILLRKRYVRDQLEAALRDAALGIEQVVIFGAGLDPLALRLKEQFPAVRFYEVDHPATQRVKRRAIQGRVEIPAGLELLAVDFAHEAAEEKLAAAPGFRADLRTYFLAEGLLMYLEEGAVDDLFRLMRRNCAPGSPILVTLLDRAELEDEDGPVPRAARMAAQVGEPFRSSYERRRIDGLLKKHGFRLREIADGTTLTAKYLKPAGLDRPVMPGELIVTGTAT